MLTLSFIHIEYTSPVNEIQDYDYEHQAKGKYQTWSLRDDVYRNESPKATKCVQFAVIYV